MCIYVQWCSMLKAEMSGFSLSYSTLIHRQCRICLEFCNTVVSRWDIKHCAVCGRGEVRYQLTMFIQFRQHASVLGRLSCYSQLCYSEVRSILYNRCMSSHSFYFKQFVTRFVEAVQFGCTDTIVIETWVDFLLRHKKNDKIVHSNSFINK